MSRIVQTPLLKVRGVECHSELDELAVEEPLEIQIEYGPADKRVRRPISVTMRTPGHDRELAVGFLISEAIIADADDVLEVATLLDDSTDEQSDAPREGEILPPQPRRNSVLVQLDPHVEVRLSALERNFYTTSSCGICGKASLLALQSVCPVRRADNLRVPGSTFYDLPAKLRAAQAIFDVTGGIHSAGIFSADGTLLAAYEDVGRHNAVDKLIGAEAFADRLPVKDRILLLSGRASFELLQKAVMAGFAIVACVGAPSSLAVQVARSFGVTLIGFLRQQHFNIYSGEHRITGLARTTEETQ